MRVTFPRLPDHERAYALVERDDGAVYRLYGGPAGPRLPHDIMHFVVERELRIRDGIWGGIAAGIVFDHPSGLQILTLAATQLSVLPDADADVDPAEVAAAAQALQVEAARWARLRVGQELSYEWPRTSPAARRARARKPRIVRPYKKRKGRRPA